MAGRIPDHFIEDLLSRVDLVELIDRHVPLKRAGKNYTCCCPFHQEKSPSFTVSPEKQFYYCFGCGASGNAVSFLMDHSHLSFVEAIESLAKTAGVEVQREGNDQPKGPDRRPLYDTLAAAQQFYAAQLKNPRVRERAQAYLRKRQLSPEIIERFGLGFAPPGWDNLVSQLGQDGKGMQLLQKTGMVVQSEQGRIYDRFRDRIMVPIRDNKGRTVAFGGRVLGDEKPKYLNSPETDVFHKGETLYGFHEARQATSKLDRILVVEGYMDVIALAQHGISFAVATLGTACTREHVETLFRTVNEVVFCFDGDRAGRAAAWRALENALPAMREARTVRFHFLPDGEDPDTQVRKHGPELFLAGIQKARPLPEYLFDHLMAQVDMETLDGRARLVGLALPLIERLPKGILQELMINRLAELTRLEKASLWNIANAVAPDAGSPTTGGTSAQTTPTAPHAATSTPNATSGIATVAPAPATGEYADYPVPPDDAWYGHDLTGMPPFGAEGFPPDEGMARPSGKTYEQPPAGQRRKPPAQPQYDYEERTPPAWGVDDKKKRKFEPRNGNGFQPRRPPPPPAPVTSLVDATIRSLLQSPRQAAETQVPREVYELTLPHMGLLIELLEYLSAHPNASTAALLGRWHATEEGEHLAALAAKEFLQAVGPLQNELGDALRKLHLMRVEQELDALISANIPDKTRFRELLHLKQELSRLKH
jgi:DNA primase